MVLALTKVFRHFRGGFEKHNDILCTGHPSFAALPMLSLLELQSDTKYPVRKGCWVRLEHLALASSGKMNGKGNVLEAFGLRRLFDKSLSQPLLQTSSPTRPPKPIARSSACSFGCTSAGCIREGTLHLHWEWWLAVSPSGHGVVSVPVQVRWWTVIGRCSSQDSND
jgi:hypothetical protein